MYNKYNTQHIEIVIATYNYLKAINHLKKILILPIHSIRPYYFLQPQYNMFYIN